MDLPFNKRLLAPSPNRAIWSSYSPVTFQARIPTILQWIEECDSKHPRCAVDNSKTEYPGRFIDVGSMDDLNNTLLVPGSQVIPRRARFVALSHCWGTDGMPSKTTRGTIETFMRSIPTNEPLKTFRDAISVTRELGIRYVWIDSLCIIQDDESDWEREAAKMASIFRFAYVTIAATSSKNCHEGWSFPPLDPALRVDFSCHTENARGPPYRAFVRPHNYLLNRIPKTLAKSPMHEKGWIFQEMILSRRIIHFTNDIFVWQCHALLESEGGSISQTSGALDSFLDLEKPDVAGRIWWSWLGEYQKRNFTQPSDRLPALAGVTRLYQDINRDTPAVGLWKNDLPIDLSWGINHYQYDAYGNYRNHDPTIRNQHLPSWSWLSIGLSNPQWITEPSFYWVAPQKSIWKADIRDVDIEWSGQPLTSPLHVQSSRYMEPSRRKF
jgi:hypothetical protein